MKSTLLLHYLILQRPLGYLLVFLGMIIEGDFVLFTAAFLTQQDFFDLGDMAIVIFSGVIIGDLIWYWLGTKLRGISASINRRVERIANHFDDHITDRQLRTLFVSKFVYGIHHAVLIRAGSLGVEISNFIRNDFIASVAWILIVGGAGYFSSLSYSLIRNYLRFVETGLLISLIVFFVLERLAIRR